MVGWKDVFLLCLITSEFYHLWRFLFLYCLYLGGAGAQASDCKRDGREFDFHSEKWISYLENYMKMEQKDVYIYD